MYGSSLMLVTRMLRDSRIAAREAAAMPFPREETTPPVTKTYLVIHDLRAGNLNSTGEPVSMDNRAGSLGHRRVKSRHEGRRATLPQHLARRQRDGGAH